MFTNHFFNMARGNLFLGMGRGSIGDVTFYRADGQQLSRVRNRKPHNPKTDSQIYQRAIMATVVKAYQAGKEIFDHSFQGYSVGAQCQRQFLALNAKSLRQQIATDINLRKGPNPIAVIDQLGRVVAPGSNTPVAYSYIISRGSYQQNMFSYDGASHGFQLIDPEENETVAEYAARVGLIGGDIYTFIVFAERDEMAYVSSLNDDALASLNYCNFGWVRCIVKSDLSSNEEAAATLNQLFDFQSSGGDFSTDNSMLKTTAIGGLITMSTLLPVGPVGYLGTGAIGLIRSRFDQDLRSDSVMNFIPGTQTRDMFGIAPEYILDEWASGTAQIGDSDLILEGGNG